MKPQLSNKKLPYAVIVGLDDYPGFQTARILSRKGVPVIGIAKFSKMFFCRTNSCGRIFYWDPEADDFIDRLVDLGEGLEQKAVLFPSTDLCVLIVSRNRKRLEPYFHLALPAGDVVEKLMNKISFFEYANKENLPIPKTFLLRQRSDAEHAARELSFPCILKPPMKTSTWEAHTTMKAYKIESAEAFLQKYDECCGWAEVLMAQEWVTGSDGSLYSCNCYFDANSEPIVTFTARKLRQWPPETGNSSLGEECRDQVVLAETIKLFQKEQWHGLGYLEMKRDARTGKYFIIEPNIGRPTGRSALAEGSGVELVYTMYCDKAGLPLPANRQQRYTGTKWVSLIEDFRSAKSYWRRGEISIRDYWQSLKGKKTYAIWSWSDPLPFLEDIRRRLAYKISAFGH